MSLSVTRSRTFPGSRRDTIDIPKNSWPLVDALIDATSVSRPWNLPPEGGVPRWKCRWKKQEIVRGTKKEGWRKRTEAASVVTSVAAASIQEWGKSERSGGREEWGREKAVSWSDSNRTSATSLRPRSQRGCLSTTGDARSSRSSPLSRVSPALRMAVRFESDCKENYILWNSRASIFFCTFFIFTY